MTNKVDRVGGWEVVKGKGEETATLPGSARRLQRDLASFLPGPAAAMRCAIDDRVCYELR